MPKDQFSFVLIALQPRQYCSGYVQFTSHFFLGRVENYLLFKQKLQQKTFSAVFSIGGKKIKV